MAWAVPITSRCWPLPCQGQEAHMEAYLTYIKYILCITYSYIHTPIIYTYSNIYIWTPIHVFLYSCMFCTLSHECAGMQMPQREFPEPPDRSMTLNELMAKAQLPEVEGPGGATLVCDLAMTPGHVRHLHFSFSCPHEGRPLPPSSLSTSPLLLDACLPIYFVSQSIRKSMG